MNFRFRVDPQHIEADNIEDALSKFACYLWFPGIIMAQEIQGLQNYGKEINLRTQTPEGIVFERTRARNKQGATYGHECLLELVKLCEAFGIEEFKFKEEGDCTIKLNQKGKALQNTKKEKGS